MNKVNWEHVQGTRYDRSAIDSAIMDKVRKKKPSSIVL